MEKSILSELENSWAGQTFTSVGSNRMISAGFGSKIFEG
jgi:hypothetical protein